MSTLPNDPLLSGPALSTICSSCRAVLDEPERQHPFHSLCDIMHSSDDGCHLCSLLLAKLERLPNNGELAAKLRGMPETKLEARLEEDHPIFDIIFCVLFEGESVVDVMFRQDENYISGLTGLQTSAEGNTEDLGRWDQVLEWIQECSESHRGSCVRTMNQLPGRLVSVGSVDGSEIKISETFEVISSADVRYMTLSHRWGSTVPLQLLTSNYQDFLKGIKLDTLPRTFRDAVKVARRLGIPFLWIDSLCIIQDSPEDWRAESGKMQQTYRGSYLSLVAIGSSDCDGGLFKSKDPKSFTPCRVQLRSDSGPRYMASDYDVRDYQEPTLDLLTRGWILQECLLPPRLLYFGESELHWTCNRLDATEVCPKGLKSPLQIYPGSIKTLQPWDTIVQQSGGLQHAESGTHARLGQNPDLWHHLVSRYSRLKLTHDSDKLVALSGLAADYGHKWDAMTYLAGLWSHELRHSLLWRVSHSKKVAGARPSQYIAPTWSWASINGLVDWVSNGWITCRDGLAEVIEANAKLLDASNPYGTVVDGFIRLKGPIIRVSVRRSKLADEHWLVDAFKGANPDDVVDKAESSPSQPGLFIRWDENPLHHTVCEAVVHLAPLETYLANHPQWETYVQLEGLLLEPTGIEGGAFRRLGHFQMIDIPYSERSSTGPPHPTASSTSDTSDVENEITEIEMQSQLNSMLYASGPHHPKGPSSPKCPSILQISLPETGGMSVEGGASDPGGSTASQYSRQIDEESVPESSSDTEQRAEIPSNRQDDFYGNGIMVPQLLERYEEVLWSDKLPQIRWLLSSSKCGQSPNSARIEETGVEVHGGGCYTYKII